MVSTIRATRFPSKIHASANPASSVHCRCIVTPRAVFDAALLAAVAGAFEDRRANLLPVARVAGFIFRPDWHGSP